MRFVMLSLTIAGLDRLSIAVTGLAWLGAGVPSVEQEMLALVRGAQREIALCAYSHCGRNEAAGGNKASRRPGCQCDDRRECARSATGQRADVLRSIARELPGRLAGLGFRRRAGQTDLHAKSLIIDRAIALIGSANLSFHGMVTNHEMAVVVRGPTAEAIAARFDMLTRSASVR